VIGPPVAEPAEHTTSSESVNVNRCKDAWIPGAATREALVAMATAPRGTYAPNASLLTMPGVKYEGSLVRNLFTLVC
jgi:hypothetical protein